VNGVCNDGINGNGSCNCSMGFSGDNCDFRCFDSDCNVNCTCDINTCSDDIIICTKDINIFNLSIPLQDLLQIIQGAITIEKSNLNITSGNIFTASSMSIADSNLYFNSSSIISTGCINLTNSNITVDLKNTSSKELLLLQSKSNCLNLSSISYSYINTPHCTLPKNEENQTTLFITISLSPTCGSEEPPFQIWIIIVIVGSILGLVILFIILVLTIPKLKYTLFPSQRIRKEMKEKLNSKTDSLITKE